MKYNTHSTHGNVVFSQEDIENFKAEIEKRQLTEDNNDETKAKPDDVEVH